MKQCPFCVETIQDEAIKCKHCGEEIVGSSAHWQMYRRKYQTLTREERQQAWASLTPAQQGHFRKVLEGQAAMGAKSEHGAQIWNPGVAGVLSLVIPGSGQIYKGQLGLGLFWLFLVVATYCFIFPLFVIPGLILHIICIVTAFSGDSTRFGG
jgi:hypothetical protein